MFCPKEQEVDGWRVETKGSSSGGKVGKVGMVPGDATHVEKSSIIDPITSATSEAFTPPRCRMWLEYNRHIPHPAYIERQASTLTIPSALLFAHMHPRATWRLDRLNRPLAGRSRKIVAAYNVLNNVKGESNVPASLDLNAAVNSPSPYGLCVILRRFMLRICSPVPVIRGDRVRAGFDGSNSALGAKRVAPTNSPTMKECSLHVENP